MKSLWRYILKKLYKLMIIRVLILDKEQVKNFNKLQVFCEYHFGSNHGPIDMIFKEDRRKKRFQDRFLFNTFVVEIKLPFCDIINRKDVLEKVVTIVNISLFKMVNYKYLAEVLMDTYVEAMYSYLQTHPDHPVPHVIKLK